MREKKKFLAISPITDGSMHQGWLRGADPDFDLMLIYCVEGTREEEFRKDAQYFIKTSGMFKLENIAYAISQFRDDVAAYEAVWLPDDDITTDAQEINRLFSLFQHYNLNLAQPSLFWDKGSISFPITIQRKECILRYTNFVEMMAPLLKTKLLFRDDIFQSFTTNRSGWGVDYLWPKILGFKDVAIMDSVGMYHKKDHYNILGGDYYHLLERNGVSAQHEFDDFIKQHGIDPTMKELSRIKKTGPWYGVQKVLTAIKLKLSKHMCYFNYLRVKALRKLHLATA